MQGYECVHLDWDTSYFGIRSARVNLYSSIDESVQERILRFCKGYKFITIANSGSNASNNNWIGTKTTAYLTDVNLQFKKDLVSGDGAVQKDKVVIANNYPFNAQLVAIAKKVYNHSRFFNDPNLPIMKAKDIYSHWTQCAFEEENKYFAVYEGAKQTAMGYMVFSIVGGNGVIELIGVDVRYQRRRIGEMMLHSMESFLLGKGVHKVRVGTQVENTSGVRFYLRMGFRYAGCNSVYHLWN